MKNNFKFLIVLAILLTACLCIGSTFAADVSVSDQGVNDIDNIQSIEIAHDDSSQEEVPNLQADSGTYRELRHEIDRASAGSTINLTKDYIFTDAIEGIFIDKSLTIDGQGHTIDGTNSSKIFTVLSDDVIIKNINFINTKSSIDGAISWRGVNGCVSGCSFINCSVSIDGGAIYWEGVNGCVSGCSFINCSSSSDGGAISWKGVNGCVSGCSFINCSASIEGGAIYWNGVNGCVSGCSFINCSSSIEGGAISWVYSDNGCVSGCSFTNCSASNSGGAIFWWSSEGSVNYNVFEGNVAECYGNAILIDGSLDCDYNFFGFENTVTTFPTNLVYGVTPSNWVVLNISKVNGQYSVNFICNNGSTLTEFMPDYIASLNIDDDVKEITIKNNTFKDAPICGDYLLTSINSGNTLARATLNWNATSYNISTTNCTYGETATVTVKINESATGNITVKVDDGQVITMPIDNGVVIITIFNLSRGVHNLNISYSGDDNYLPFETTEFTVTVYKTTPDVIVSVENVTYGEDAVVNVSVVGVGGKAIPSGNVTIFVNGSEVANVTLNDGKCNYTISDLNAGNYNITIVYNEDNNYTSVENSAGLTVIPKEIDIVATLENITYGDNLSGSVNAGMKGKVAIQVVPGCTPIYADVDVSGEFTVPIDLVAGDYPNAYISFLSVDGNYIGGADVSFTVSKAYSIVTVDPVKGKAGEKVTITARVTDENGNSVNEGKVIIGFNGKEYTANVVDGIATVEVVLPSAGTYSATAYYEGFNYNSSSSTFTVEVSDIPGPNPNPNPVNNGVGNMENTGNPLLVLLIALCAIGLESFRRKF